MGRGQGTLCGTSEGASEGSLLLLGRLATFGQDGKTGNRTSRSLAALLSYHQKEPRLSLEWETCQKDSKLGCTHCCPAANFLCKASCSKPHSVSMQDWDPHPGTAANIVPVVEGVICNAVSGSGAP